MVIISGYISKFELANRAVCFLAPAKFWPILTLSLLLSKTRLFVTVVLDIGFPASRNVTTNNANQVSFVTQCHIELKNVRVLKPEKEMVLQIHEKFRLAISQNLEKSKFALPFSKKNPPKRSVSFLPPQSAKLCVHCSSLFLPIFRDFPWNGPRKKKSVSTPHCQSEKTSSSFFSPPVNKSWGGVRFRSEIPSRSLEAWSDIFFVF